MRTLLPEDQRLLSDQQLRDASDEQLQVLIARVDLLLRSKGQSGLTLESGHTFARRAVCEPLYSTLP